MVRHTLLHTVVVRHTPSWSVTHYRTPSWSVARRRGPSHTILVRHTPSWSVVVRRTPSWFVARHRTPLRSVARRRSPSHTIAVRRTPSRSVVLSCDVAVVPGGSRRVRVYPVLWTVVASSSTSGRSRPIAGGYRKNRNGRVQTGSDGSPVSVVFFVRHIFFTRHGSATFSNEILSDARRAVVVFGL